ncbi:hypothetical protein GB881_15165 [Georgenia subflava]|uniref:Core-binding (CB) domain-containing protein n=1 Tax=Georgenia subflava TaxID=1622177 RepID=A0A6N7EJL6_9MICO|nr:hypothetical protein [Georgenia subflava]
MRQTVRDYLRVRRALGHTLRGVERVLDGFVDHLPALHADTVTVEHALACATALAELSARSRALRLSAIPCFTRWTSTIDPSIEVPRAGCCRQAGPGPCRTSTPARRSVRCCGRPTICAQRSGPRASHTLIALIVRHRDTHRGGPRPRRHRPRPDQ